MAIDQAQEHIKSDNINAAIDMAQDGEFAELASSGLGKGIASDLKDRYSEMTADDQVESHSQFTKSNTMILTPHLPLYAGGAMFIELDTESQSIQIGSTVAGKIKASVQDSFSAKRLTISLRGYQRASFKPSVASDKFEKAPVDQVRNTKTLIDEKFILEEFDAGSEVQGVLEFPFLIKIPDWLQPSLMCQFEENNISLTYYLCAQFDPNSSDQVANEDDGTSTLRADCTVYLHKSVLDEETKDQQLATSASKNLQKSLEMQIGGIAGIGRTPAKAEISLEKLEHHVGDGI